MKACAVTTKRKVENESVEFCEAYETVCFEIPEGEPDQPTLALEFSLFFVLLVLLFVFPTFKLFYYFRIPPLSCSGFTIEFGNFSDKFSSELTSMQISERIH